MKYWMKTFRAQRRLTRREVIAKRALQLLTTVLVACAAGRAHINLPSDTAYWPVAIVALIVGVILTLALEVVFE